MEKSLFDPISGEGSTGRRLLLTLDAIPSEQGGCHDGFVLNRQWIPETMREDPLCASLLRTNSLHKTGRELSLPPDVCARRFFRLRCLHDFPFWAAALVKIKRKGGGEDIPFVLNFPQRKLVERFESMRLAQKPIRLVLLKARQWGGSTCTQIYMAWLQLMHAKGLNSLIIAHQGAGSDEIKDMFDRMIEAYPEEMLREEDDEGETQEGKKRKSEPKTKSAGRSGLAMRITARNCKLKIGSAERPDSCRGGDYNLVHLSEVGIWKRTQGKCPEDIVRSACSGVLLQPLTMIVLESTANGTGTFFHREYLAASNGESQFEALFIPWYEIETYRLPLSESERNALVEEIEAGRGSTADRGRRPSGEYLYAMLQKGVAPEAIAWYLTERSKYSDQAQMAAEYPGDDLEAFAHSGARVFDRSAVERLREMCSLPTAVGEIVSDLPDGAAGCLEGVRFVADTQGCLDVWRFPPEGRTPMTDRYLAVVDVGGRSVKADWSVVTVFDRLPMLVGRGPEVAAQWRGHCDIDILAWCAARIASFYDNALLVIESNSMESRDKGRWVEGDQTPFILLQIRDEYPNLYERSTPADEIREGRPTRLGFHTNVRTKPAIISNLVKMVREGEYTERDQRTLDELLQYERRGDGSYGAILGAHDDLLMTRAIGLFISRYEMPLPCQLAVYPRSTTARSRLRSPRNATESTLF